MHHPPNGTDDEEWRRTLVTARGGRLVVVLDGTGVIVTAGGVPIRLTHVEARTLGVSVVLCAVVAREAEES